MPIKATFTGDVTDLRRGTEQARQEFKKVGTEAEGAARQLKAVGSSFDGTRLEGAARRVASGIERIGGVARLTDSEVAKNSRTLNELLQKYERMGVEAPANIRKLATELEHAAGSARKLDSATSGLGSSLKSGFGALAGGLGIGLGAGAGLAAISSIGGAIREAATEAARLGPLAQAFERLQGGAASAQQALITLREATRGLVSDTELMRLSNQQTQLGLAGLGVDFSKLAQTAVTLGAAVGQNATESIEALVGALGRGSTEVLDNVGVTLRVSEAQEIYAARLGTTSEKLTDQQKKQAFVTIAMERAEAKAKSLGEQNLTVAQNFERIGLAMGDIAAQALSAGNQSATLAGALGEVADMLLKIRGAGIGTTFRVVASEAAGAVQQAIKPFLSPFNFGGALLSGAAASVQQAAGVTADDLLTVLTGRPQRTGKMGTPPAGGGTAGPVGPTKEELAAIKRYREELEKLTGEALVADGQRLARQLRDIAAAGKSIATDNLDEVAQRLMAARRAADQTSVAFRQMGEALNTLAIPSRRIEGLESLLNINAIGFQSRDAIAAAQRNTGSLPGFGTDITSTNPLMMAGLAPTITSNFRRAQVATRDWRAEVRGLSQAFSQLAQIAGPSLDGISRSFGSVVASSDAAFQTVQALSSQFSSLGDGKGGLSKGGRALAGGLSGLAIGLQLGQFQTDLGGAFLSGAAGGAATGGLSGGWVGAGVGAAIGGISAIYAANQNRKAQRQAMAAMRDEFIASFGTLEDFRAAVENAGTSYDRFMELLNSDDPDTFRKTMNSLTMALTSQRDAADKLIKSLQAAARVQGVLSRGDLVRISNRRPGDPGAAEILEFAQQQRQQAEQGIASAIAALDTATAGGTQHMDDFEASVGAVTTSLAVLFQTAVQNGESAVSILQRLAEPIQTLQRMLAASGIQAGAGFGQLSVLSDIATGTQTGPLVQLAQGLGQALAGFANTGLLSPELFAELANGIGEAYHQLELFGKGGLEAARLMQPSLQAIWQMIQDNPALRDTLDDTTLALLDFAEQSGLIGEKFRPAIDQMLDALDRLIEKIEEMIDSLNGIPPKVTTTITTVHDDEQGAGNQQGGGGGGGGLDENDHVILGAGGIVTHPTRALIGEAGPEAVIPLSRLGHMGAPISITVVSQIDGYEAARAVTRWQPEVYRTYGAA